MVKKFFVGYGTEASLFIPWHQVKGIYFFACQCLKTIEGKLKH